MQHTSGFAVLVGGALLAATLGCAPDDGACEANTDCPFGQMCFEGTCAIGGGSGAGGGGGGFFGDGGGTTQGMTGNVSATLDGVIGGTTVTATTGLASVGDRDVMLQIVDARFTSTFLIAAALPISLFAVPGRQTIGTGGLDGSYSQACNYDAGAYDEFFNEFIIDVGAPRDPAETDTGTGEDGSGGSFEVLTPPGPVIDVTISVNGEGSRVVGTAAIPTAMLRL